MVEPMPIKIPLIGTGRQKPANTNVSVQVI